jgi:hypothetical protein
MLTDKRKDERTDMTKLTVTFRNFANAPNNRFLEVLPETLPVYQRIKIFTESKKYLSVFTF